MCHLKREREREREKTNATSQGTSADPKRNVAAWRPEAQAATQQLIETLTHSCSDLSTETTHSYTNQHIGSHNLELYTLHLIK